MSRSLLIAVLAAQSCLFAQIERSPVPFPGPSNGPLGLPGGQIPYPRRGGRGGGGQTADKSLRTEGKLRKIDQQTVVVEASDARVITFRRTSQTKFYKDSKETDVSAFKPGDRIAVSGTENDQGNLYAERVDWESAASEASTGSTDSSGTADAPPAAKPDPDDPGPPVLRRGPPPTRTASARDDAGSVPADASASQPVADDHYIREARDVAGEFAEHLPNYACTEYMTRYVSTTKPVDWHAQDVVSADILHGEGVESYRNVAINGKPTNKAIDQLQGAWSTGEFASTMTDLFSPATAAEFRFRGQSRIDNKTARVFDFSVDQGHSHWHVQASSQSINPAYKGSVWIDPENARVLRIEMQARALPREFPFDTVESSVDYGQVSIGGQQFLLPVHAENLACERGTPNCSHNAIDFRNYHKFDANSTVLFGGTQN